MALIKEIILENGIPTNYHRTVSVNNITNHASIIEVASYVSEEKRKEEIEKLKNKEHINVFIHTEYLSIDYVQNLNVDTAYEYLKTLDKFAGAIDG